MGDRVGWGMARIGDSNTSTLGLLRGSSRSMGGSGIGVALEVNHMGWYRLRARVDNTRCIVCCCVFVCRTIAHDRDDILSTGIDRIMWTTKGSTVIWRWSDSAEKVTVSPKSGV